jgi:hypothetical protein
MDVGIVQITEGVLKSDIVTALSGVMTIGLPGIGNWRQAVPVLRWIGHPSASRVKTVRLAFDADARRKPVVALALKTLFEALKEESSQ